jgi:hypothetical protein
MDIEVVLFVPATNNQTGERTFKFTGVQAPSIGEKGILEVFRLGWRDVRTADFRDWSYWRQVKSSHMETEIA